MRFDFQLKWHQLQFIQQQFQINVDTIIFEFETLIIFEQKVISYLNKQMKPNKSNNPNLPIKMLFLAYLSSHQRQQIVQDCYNALNNRIQKLTKQISQNHKEIIDIVGTQPNNKYNNTKMMDIIYEEEFNTQRSFQTDQQLFKSGSKMQNSLSHKFNTLINIIERSSTNFQDTIFMYKNQLKQIAKDLTQERQLTKKLAIELKQQNMNNSSKQRSNSLNRVPNNKQSISISNQMMKINKNVNIPKSNRDSSSLLSKKAKIYQQSQDEHARQAPKPFCQQCVARENKQNKQVANKLQQKIKWRQLSSKITLLKSQLTTYQQQLVTKQTQINKLTQQLSKSKNLCTQKQTQDKKKLRSMNTTLRGEKIMLENHISNLRKKNQENQQYLQKLQMDNNKTKIEKDNLQSTIQWHLKTINDLRNNFTNGLKQDADLVNKINETQNKNKMLYGKISEQQKYLHQFVEKLKIIQNTNNQDKQSFQKKIQELQNIIEQKNQTIIKMKMNQYQTNSTSLSLNQSRQLQKKRDDSISIAYGTIMTKTLKRQLNQSTDQSQNFQGDMIRILNRKVSQKDNVIQKLQRQNQLLKLQIEEYKY